MTPNSTLEPVTRQTGAPKHDDVEIEAIGGVSDMAEAGDAVVTAVVADDRPGGHLGAVIVQEDDDEVRRDGAKELLKGSWRDLDWVVLGWIGGIHIAALAAPSISRGPAWRSSPCWRGSREVWASVWATTDS